MDHTTYEIDSYVVSHVICGAEIENVGSYPVLTLSTAMESATKHNANCPAIKRGQKKETE